MDEAEMAPGYWLSFRGFFSQGDSRRRNRTARGNLASAMVFLQRGQEVRAVEAIRAAVAKFDLRCGLARRPDR